MNYERIAHVFKTEITRLKKLNEAKRLDAVIVLVENISVALAIATSRFDKAKFLRACGLEDNDTNK